jgi:hypothetical protein
LDEADPGIAVFSQGIASISGAAAVGASLEIRHNVVAVDGVSGGDGLALGARFRDAGAAERIILRLKRYSFMSGVTQTLLTLASNTFPLPRRSRRVRSPPAGSASTSSTTPTSSKHSSLSPASVGFLSSGARGWGSPSAERRRPLSGRSFQGHPMPAPSHSSNSAR